jgi:hypothetical protein
MGCCGKVVDGVAGLAKFGAQSLGLRVDQASDETMLRRRDVCRECPHATRNAKRLNRSTKGLTSLSRCELCDCFIGAKTALASERCPASKW